MLPAVSGTGEHRQEAVRLARGRVDGAGEREPDEVRRGRIVRVPVVDCVQHDDLALDRGRVREHPRGESLVADDDQARHPGMEGLRPRAGVRERERSGWHAGASLIDGSGGAPA
jgi:hypothetical protein